MGLISLPGTLRTHRWSWVNVLFAFCLLLISTASQAQLGAGVSMINLLPADGARLAGDATPTISATFQSNGSPVNKNGAVLTVDGKNVTSRAQVTTTGISYKPAIAFKEGVHSVTLRIADNGDDITTQAVITNSGFRYVLPGSLDVGTHVVLLRVTNLAGRVLLAIIG